MRPSPTRRASSSASRRSTASTRWAASRLRAARTKKPSSCRSWCAPRSATTTSIPARASAIRPTGYGLKHTLGESAGTQAFISVMKSDVIMVIGANPTDGHPVFASQMKRRLRQGAKLIVIDPRETGIVRSPHIAGGLPPAAASGHERRRDQRAGARHRDRRPDEGRLRRRALRARSRSRSGRRSSPRSATRPKPPKRITRRAGASRARCRAAVRDRRQRRDLLRPRRHRAQPGHDDGHGHREPRDGHRQSRPRRRGRESAARPEQRAGLVRHGLVPARVAGLPAHFRCPSRAISSTRSGA